MTAFFTLVVPYACFAWLGGLAGWYGHRRWNTFKGGTNA